MFTGVAVIVFSFLIRVQFPKSKSIAEIIRSRYIKTILKKFGNWRNLISVYAKQSKISNFYVNVTMIMLILKFLIFVRQIITWNTHLFTINVKKVYWEKKLNWKKSAVQNLQKEFSSFKASLQNELHLIDFAHITNLIRN